MCLKAGHRPTTFASSAAPCRRTILITSATSSAIVDASVFVDAVLDLRLAAVLARLDWHAPVTIDAELVHALRRNWLVGRISDAQAASAFEALRTRAITRHPVEPLVQRMWSLRRNITAYDASYVALAESLALPLITRDRRLAHSSGHAATIEYID
ncbi:MAG TPA: type II toxin-antitoxin system VapC family toxin [Thermoanaerobaculia bacterium]